MNLPKIVKVSLQGVHDAGAIDTEVYCVNDTAEVFEVSTRSRSFTTVDEETGAAIEHGSQPTFITLEPGRAAQIADVAGWEWDGAVVLEVSFRLKQDASTVTRLLNLKHSEGEYEIRSLEKRGWLVPIVD